MFDYDGKLIYSGRDAYTSVQVIQNKGLNTLHFGSRVAQSSMFLDDPFKVEMEYNQAMLLSLLYKPQPKSVLSLGLGGGAKQKFLWKHLDCHQVCVELSPLVIDVGRRFFEIPQDDRLQIVQMDALEYLQKPQEQRFDIILIDLYDAEGMSPLLGEKELFQLCHEILLPDGILVWNLWRSTGKKLLDSSVQHLGSAFGNNFKLLTVEESLNLVVFSFVDPSFKTTYHLLSKRAEALSIKTGLDFTGLFSRQPSLHF